MSVEQNLNNSVTRGLLQLNESFRNDEEYNASNCLHYSKLKNLYDNPELLLKKEQPMEDKEWLIFGRLVDLILTTSYEEQQDLIFISNIKPSAQFEKMANYIIDNNISRNISELSNNEINLIYSDCGSKVNWSVDTKRKNLEEACSEYFKVLEVNKSKFIISSDTYNEATKVAEVFSTHRWTKGLFMSEKDQISNNIEIIYQYKIKYIYKGIQCKSKIDLVLIDHDAKKISLFDTKTGSDTPRHFIRHSLYKYGYGYQGGLYREGFTEFIKTIPSLASYDIDVFRFIYVSRIKPTYPIILQMSEICHQEFVDWGIENGEYSLPALIDIFEATNSYIERINSGVTLLEPFDIYKSNGEMIARTSSQGLIM